MPFRKKIESGSLSPKMKASIDKYLQSSSFRQHIRKTLRSRVNKLLAKKTLRFRVNKLLAEKIKQNTGAKTKKRRIN